MNTCSNILVLLRFVDRLMDWKVVSANRPKHKNSFYACDFVMLINSCLVRIIAEALFTLHSVISSKIIDTVLTSSSEF